MIVFYKPEDRFLFGAYEGEELRFVYTFDPSYIEYCVLEYKDFAIDLESFERLHTYDLLDKTPFKNNPRNMIGVDSDIVSLRYFLENYLFDVLKHYYSKNKDYNKYSFKSASIQQLEAKIVNAKNKNLVFNPNGIALAKYWGLKIDSNINSGYYKTDIFIQKLKQINNAFLGIKIDNQRNKKKCILVENSSLTEVGEKYAILLLLYCDIIGIDLSMTVIKRNILTEHDEFMIHNGVIYERLNGIYSSILKDQLDNNFQNLNVLARLHFIYQNN